MGLTMSEIEKLKELIKKIHEMTESYYEDLVNEVEDYPHDGGWSFLEVLAEIHEMTMEKTE